MAPDAPDPAFVRFYEEHFDLIQAEIFMTYGNHHVDCEAVTTAAFIACGRRWSEIAHPVRWTKCEAARLAAEAARPNTGLAVASLEKVLHGIAPPELRPTLAAVDRLPDKERFAFVQRTVFGVTYEVLAELMGCTAGTVRVHVNHARAKLAPLPEYPAMMRFLGSSGAETGEDR